MKLAYQYMVLTRWSYKAKAHDRWQQLFVGEGTHWWHLYTFTSLLQFVSDKHTMNVWLGVPVCTRLHLQMQPAMQPAMQPEL